MKRQLQQCLLAIGLCATTAFVPPIVAAQSDAELVSDLRACQRVQRDPARLACYDGVLGPSPAATIAAGEGGSPIDESTGPGGREAGSVAAVAARGDSADRDAATVADAGAARERQVRSPTPETGDATEGRLLRIVEVNADRGGGARFHADTGEVFVQTTGSVPPGGFPDVPFDAQLEPGALGSQFLSLGDSRRRIRVRPVD